MSNWDYGNVWESYPIKPGEVWESQSGDKVMVGDLTKDNVKNLCESVDLVYVDPPWGQGLLSGFRTKAGISEKQSFDDFLARMFRVISSVNPKYVFIEMGNAWVDSLCRAGNVSGRKVVDTYPITYNDTRPATLLQFRGSAPSLRVYPLLEKVYDDSETPRIVVESLNDKVSSVLDLCTGRGATAEAAWEHKKVFYGMELNPKRLAWVLRTGKEGYEMFWTRRIL